MAIMYGFTKDQGFALVDTDTRVYLYGYPTSDLQVYARRAGARKAAEARVDGLHDLAQFVARCRALPANQGQNVEQTAPDSYEHVFAQMVAPEVLI